MVCRACANTSIPGVALSSGVSIAQPPPGLISRGHHPVSAHSPVQDASNASTRPHYPTQSVPHPISKLTVTHPPTYYCHETKHPPSENPLVAPPSIHPQKPHPTPTPAPPSTSQQVAK